MAGSPSEAGGLYGGPVDIPMIGPEPKPVPTRSPFDYCEFLSGLQRYFNGQQCVVLTSCSLFARLKASNVKYQNPMSLLQVWKS